jgi:serine/threonine-protein phosphatase 2A regulatory subunit A
MQVVEMVKNPNYLHRMSVLYCLRDLSKAVAVEDASGRIVPVIIEATSDPVPNIRFVAAKILQQLQPVMSDALVEEDVKPCLTKLCQDGDADVRYYAEAALYEFSGGSAPMTQ